jgi:stress responsive alpha/beta barrel protein
MSKQSRRNFIANTGKAALITSFASLTYSTASAMTASNIFVHHVFFYLKNPASTADRDKLVEGLKKLSKVKTIKSFHIGKPADTHRDVVERGYNISWMLHFANPADQESYQTDPIHLKFIEENSALWQKVVVYDTVDV